MELLLVFVYIFIIWLVCHFIKLRQLNKYKNFEYKYFISGILLKILGALVFAMVYTFHYSYGDTFEYFKSGTFFFNFLFEEPKEWLHIFLSSSSGLRAENYEINSGYTIYLAANTQEPFYYETDFLLMAKIITILSFITFRSYFLMNILFAVLSFTGIWKLFQTFIKIYPNNHREFAIAIFYVPSVVFWGSCLMKDSITIAALGWFFYSCFDLFFVRKNKYRSLVTLFISALLIMGLKPYVLLSFLPVIIIWFYLTYKTKIKNYVVRAILSPIILTFAVVGSGFMIIYIAAQSEKYQINKIESTAKTFQSFHGSLKDEDGGGSVYSLGDVDFSPIGLIKTAPAAINVTMFRPYLWEVRSPIMLFSALESFLLMIFTIWICFKVGISNVFKIIKNNNNLILCFLFAIILGFFVGLTSYNFGALVRYKIPAIIFYTIGLSVLYTEGMRIKDKKFRAKFEADMRKYGRPSFQVKT